MTKSGSGERERKRGVYYDRFTNENKTERIDFTKRDRVSSLPEVFQPRVHYWPERYGDGETSDGKNQISELHRRHSWSSGTSYGGFDFRDFNRPSRKLSQQSSGHGSSSHSIPEIIEECSGDDESIRPEPEFKQTEYMRCRNCFQKDKTVLIVKTDKYPYCKKCRDLLRNKNKYGTMIPLMNTEVKKFGPVSGCGGDSASISPSRRSRKSSLPETIDLPCIEEPSTGEEGADTKELQLIVEREVNKLLNFGNANNHHKTTNKGLFRHQKRRNSDNDLELITVGFKNMLMRKNTNYIP
uniref:Uncharacterized protein n=1 Tax=Clytia hemisphaerica TaxID=252671 RepID=A0A7M5V596_9CNID|eukprot:TCONS_00003976-protein